MKTALTLMGVTIALCVQPLKASAQETAGPTLVQFDDLPAQLEITELRRADDNTTLMLRSVIKNPSGQAVNVDYVYDMSLIDFKNRRKYLVIKDSSLECVCTTNAQVIAPPGGVIHIWAKFPAPPDSVTSFSFGWGRAQPANLQITK